MNDLLTYKLIVSSIFIYFFVAILAGIQRDQARFAANNNRAANIFVYAAFWWFWMIRFLFRFARDCWIEFKEIWRHS